MTDQEQARHQDPCIAAADGLSNKAIAEQVFVSVKTVESNLKRAYAKLGISSRAQLARALDRGVAQPNS